MSRRRRARLQMTSAHRRFSGSVPALCLVALLLAPACQEIPEGEPGGAIEGIVKAPDGEGVPGATVVAIVGSARAPDDLRPFGTATADAAGRFRFADLPLRDYDLSVSAPGYAAAFRAGVSATPGGSPESVEIPLAEEAVVVSGAVRDGDGRPIPGAAVRILRAGDDRLEAFFASPDASSAYAIGLSPGWYTLIAEGPGFIAARRHTRLFADSVVEFELDSAADLEAPAPEPVVEWLRRSAVPLDSVEAGGGFRDLRPLASAFDGARIVAFGESTHGTREFFLLRHRLLEFLVEEMDFSVLAIEAGFTGAVALDDYIQGGPGAPAGLLKGLGYWTWDNLEVLEVIRWMRAYNEDPSHAKKLKIYGFDIRPLEPSVRGFIAYLERVDPAHAAHALRILEPIGRAGRSPDPSPEEANEIRAGLAALEARMTDRKARYVARSSLGEWEVAGRQLAVIREGEEASRSFIGSYVLRDRAMAANVAWIARREAGARIVLWSHNSHAALGRYGGGALSMGHHLRRAFGDAYVACGLFFGHGTFRASSGRRLRNFAVAPPPEGTLEAALARTRRPILSVDLRRAPGTGAVGEWLAAPHPARHIGSLYDRSDPDAYLRPPIAPRREFDLLFFVESTSAARATTRRRPAGTLPPPLPSPRNLDLEEGQPGALPVDWMTNDWSRASGYTALLTDSDAYAGERSAMLAHPDRPPPGGFGVLLQRIDARPYRGRRVRFRAAVRAEVAGAGSEARLYLRVDRESGEVSFFDNMDDRPIRKAEWDLYEIAGAVDPDARAIDFGMILVGGGKAFLDAVSLEPAGE